MNTRVATQVLMVATLMVGTSCAPDPNDVVAPLPSTSSTAPKAGVAPTETTAAPVPAVETTGVVMRVRAIDNNFRPQALQVKVGDTVEFSNGGRNDHDVVPVDGAVTWGVTTADFGPGAIYTHIFDKPGEYQYYCSIHADKKNKTAGMVGTITVTD